MTTFEHAMLGMNVALAVGTQRRYGWGLPAMAATAGAFPDWDALSIVLGGSAYGRVHRVWGHNLLAASLAGLGVGGLGYVCYLSARVQRMTARLWQASSSQQEPPRTNAHFSRLGLVEWLVLGWLAAVVHLPADVLFSGRPDMIDWPLKLLWPFSPRGWAWPIVPWGDVVTSVIFVIEMFALYRWPRSSQTLACLSLLAVTGYIALRWFLAGT